MNINYYLDNPSQLYWRLLRISIASVTANMPGAFIRLVHPAWFDIEYINADAQLAVAGIPRGINYAYRRFLCNANVPAGDNLFLDVDTVVQRNVSSVFQQPFDIALARRERLIVPTIPFNGGVIFCRDQEIWRAMSKHGDDMSDNWQEAEQSLSTAALSGRYLTKELSGRIYNYSPDAKETNTSHAAIVHYKGQRKNWMLSRAKEFE